MDLMESIFDRAKANPQRVAFPEGTDETMMRAAAEAAARGIAIAVLVGDEKVTDLNAVITPDQIGPDGLLIRKGKKSYMRLVRK